ncbi:MAG: hypothetical protein R3208_07420 [Ketobacteraceae bacterium]|nr:hypothetical protein [Ketobacteraceae bacterium]
MIPRIKFPLVALFALLLTACGGGNGNTDYFALQIKPTGSGSSGFAGMHAVAETPEGGMILAGRRSGDLWAMKFSPEGNLLWENTYLKTFFVYKGIFPLDDGGFAAIGMHEGSAFYLALESNGSVRFLKTYPGLFYEEVSRASNGFYMMGGVDFGGAGLVHIDDAGNVLFASEFTNLDTITRTLELPNGELFVVGEKGNPYSDDGRVDLGLLRVSAQGDLLDSRVIGRDRMVFDADGLHLNADQQIVMAGDMEHGFGTPEAVLVEPFRLVINSNLDVLSASTYRFFKESRAFDILPTNDGGSLMLIELGEIDSQHTALHPTLVKLDAAGAMQWKKRYQFPDSKKTAGWQLLQTSMGYLFAGLGYEAYDYFGFAISTDFSGVIVDSDLSVVDVSFGTRSSLSLTTYNNPVEGLPLTMEPIVHQNPIPVATNSQLTRY